jgi:hypothetical protein
MESDSSESPKRLFEPDSFSESKISSVELRQPNVYVTKSAGNAKVTIFISNSICAIRIIQPRLRWTAFISVEDPTRAGNELVVYLWMKKEGHPD